MRVAHFIHRYPPALGGSESFFERLGRHLAACGDEVSVFTSNALELGAFWSLRGSCLPAGTKTDDGVKVHRYSLLRWPGRRYFLKPLALMPNRLWQCLALPCNPISLRMWLDAGRTQQRFDLVHATAFPYAWPIACGLRLARRLRVPFVLTPFLHLGDPEDPGDPIRRAYLSPALLWLIHAANRVFVQTEIERAALLNEGVSEDKLILLGMGVDLDECTGGDRERMRREWGVGADEVAIGHLANKSVEKGSVDLLSVAGKLWQRGRNFRLVLAGPEMPNFQSFWKTFAPKDRILQMGILDEKQKRDFFASIDVFALPSRSDSFGIVLLEAWANGVPNIAYKAGGVAEVIRHGQDGLLVSCGDLESFASSLCRLIDNRELRSQLGSRGMDRVHREFKWTQKLDCVQGVYQELIGKLGMSVPCSFISAENRRSRLPA